MKNPMNSCKIHEINKKYIKLLKAQKNSEKVQEFMKNPINSYKSYEINEVSIIRLKNPLNSLKIY